MQLGWKLILAIAVLALIWDWLRDRKKRRKRQSLLLDSPTLEVLLMGQRAIFTLTLPEARQGGRPVAPDEILSLTLQIATRDQENFYTTVKEWQEVAGTEPPFEFTVPELDDGPWFARAFATSAEGVGAIEKINFTVGSGELQPLAAPGLSVRLESV